MSIPAPTRRQLVGGTAALMAASAAAAASIVSPARARGESASAETQRDLVHLGTYKGKPIVWRALAQEDGRTLLICDQIITSRPYHSVVVDAITWEERTLRSWLNGEFLEDCFTLEEAERIQVSTLQNADNDEYGTPGGNPTEDKIFLLSNEECELYFESPEDRVTTFSHQAALEWRDWVAVNHETFGMDVNAFDPAALEAGLGWWVLRSPGQGAYWVSGVMTTGEFYATGHCYHVCAVRPALWMS